MASLRPVPFVINDDEDWGTLLAPPTSLSVHPSTTSSAVTGEFNAFSFVGAVISGGGFQTIVVGFRRGRTPVLRQGGFE